MKNFVQRGEIVTLAAPYDVASGAGLLVGAIFGVATSAALSGEPVETAVCGVYELAKTSAQAWTVGAKVYWDDTAKVCTTVPTSNTLIGIAVEPATNPSPRGIVRLNGAF